MTTKYLLPVVAVLLLLLATSCITVVNPPVTTNGPTPGGGGTGGGGTGGGTPGGGTTQPQLQVSIWTDRVTYSVGEPITLYYSINQAANLTLTGYMPDGTQYNYFTNVLHGAGQDSVHLIANAPYGQRELRIVATSASGQMIGASTTYTVNYPFGLEPE